MHQPVAHPGGVGAFRAALPIVLASASPRRLELLGSLGIAFLVDAANGSEPLPQAGEEPAAFAVRAAQAKARETAARHPAA
jgi:septum formation protein